MSAQLKSFQGPDVQVLLDRIRVEMGPRAKINGAEKVRVGGLFGFFAKEQYRVTAEAPDDDGKHASSVPAPDPKAVDLREPVTASRPGELSDVLATTAATADDVHDVTLVDREAAPPPDSGTIPSPPTSDSASAGFTMRPGEPAPSPPFPPGTTDAREHGGPERGTTPPGESDLGDDDLPPARTDIAAKAVVFLAGTTTETNSTLRPPDPPAAGSATTLAGALRRVGLGDDMVRRISEHPPGGNDLEARLTEVLSDLPDPPPPPRGPGTLLVVVGAGMPARHLGAALAGEMGQDPTAVPFASLDPGAYAVATGKLLIRHPTEASERSAGWRRSKTAVVVVDDPVTGDEQSWASHVIAALRPTMVWGLVDCTCKTEDVVAWIAGLGGVNALALRNIHATVSPASFLNVGVPVARFDGHPASPALWAATIMDRIS